MADESYIDYFDVLGVTEDCKAGEVRRTYKKKMKDLVIAIARTEITEARRDKFLLDMAKLNAAFYILRDTDRRMAYVDARTRVIQLEEEWRAVPDDDRDASDRLRRGFDRVLRDFLSAYMEELIMQAGRDKECVEASNWNIAHERHAGRILRHFRQRLYHEIHERLPFYDVSKPAIDWDERQVKAAALLAGEA